MKQRPRRSRSPIGREGKGQGFETETQEVLSLIGSAYCSLKRLGKHHKQNRECLLLTTESRQAPLTTMLTVGREGKRQGFETETQEVLIEAGI